MNPPPKSLPSGSLSSLTIPFQIGTHLYGRPYKKHPHPSSNIGQIFVHGPRDGIGFISNDNLTKASKLGINIIVHSSYQSKSVWTTDRSSPRGVYLIDTLRIECSMAKRLASESVAGVVLHLPSVIDEEQIERFLTINTFPSRLYLENEPESLNKDGSLPDYVKLLNSLKRFNIGMTIDTAHLDGSGFPYEEAIRIMDNLEVPFMVHLNDNNPDLKGTRRDNHFHLLEGGVWKSGRELSHVIDCIERHNPPTIIEMETDTWKDINTFLECRHYPDRNYPAEQIE